MTEKKVSVIIPIYNAAQYLHKCLKSVISQTYKNLDIIMIDDGSSDDSYSIAKEYQEKDSRIRLFTQTNIGLISTRKRGIELAEGEIVGFVDSDDWIEPIMYERLVQRLEYIVITQMVREKNGMIFIRKEFMLIWNRQFIHRCYMILKKMKWD